MNLSQTFAQRFAAALEEAGLNQSEFARQAGVSRAYVNQLMHGVTSPRLETVEKYADVLDLPAWLLLLDLDNPEIRAAVQVRIQDGELSPNLLRLCALLNGLEGAQRQMVLAALRGMLEESAPPQ